MWNNLYGTDTLPKVRSENGFSIIMNESPNLNCIYNYVNSDGTIFPIENHCAGAYAIITNTKSANYNNYLEKTSFPLLFTLRCIPK